MTSDRLAYFLQYRIMGTEKDHCGRIIPAMSADKHIRVLNNYIKNGFIFHKVSQKLFLFTIS